PDHLPAGRLPGRPLDQPGPASGRHQRRAGRRARAAPDGLPRDGRRPPHLDGRRFRGSAARGRPQAGSAAPRQLIMIDSDGRQRNPYRGALWIYALLAIVGAVLGVAIYYSYTESRAVAQAYQ